MTRASCKHPDACVAGARGPCRKCHDCSAASEHMRQLNADPEFAKANAERSREHMRRLNAKRRGFEIPEHLSDLYHLARRYGFSPVEALAWADNEHRRISKSEAA